MSMQSTYFVIIGGNDRLLYEYPKESSMKYASDNEYVLNQFVILSALDFIEEKKKSSSKMYFKTIDVYGSHHLSAFVTAGNVKFILMSSAKTDETKAFFNAVYELYVKIVLNPFYELQSPIESDTLTEKIQVLLKTNKLE
ncbi:trafficking protein particle complex subunit, putative [Entamoeba invadens IP1]|uniref:Trafficking protein particle complex subunit, putative n=1 Tax=Entamoeba invadens IP1 TaxID=370355 RepID=L7FNK6_ENTIV|nr:trafficking protein particle complex subunit, putative [Entamoeba invadens IP1]ELP92259.1 trafficking protein particle complex subunit, putative [Entamoeba invadens IP1]|eukprot:XP_004259030.1 trafficking protein particle complex subunit, putative [Entamoeba invadens IP1]